MANEKHLNPPNLDALVNAGSHAQTAAKPHAESKPETIDLSHLYGESGGKIASPPAGSGKRVDLSSLYGERGGLLQTQTTADEPTKE